MKTINLLTKFHEHKNEITLNHIKKLFKIEL
jgi:hypothetical protein